MTVISFEGGLCGKRTGAVRSLEGIPKRHLPMAALSLLDEPDGIMGGYHTAGNHRSVRRADPAVLTLPLSAVRRKHRARMAHGCERDMFIRGSR